MTAFHNFLITGHGRCGTKWLAELMDRDPHWTVRHEPNPRKRHLGKPEDLADVQRTFARDRYGEVNSCRRTLLLDLDVEHKGVIVRHPLEILLSAVNADPGQWIDYRDHLGQLAESLGLIAVAEEEKVAAPIWFRELVEDLDYCASVLRHFGITVPVAERDLLDVKNSRRRRIGWRDIPRQTRVSAERGFQWFVDAYDLGEPKLHQAYVLVGPAETTTPGTG